MDPNTIALLVMGGLCLVGIALIVLIVTVAGIVILRRDPRRTAQRALKKAVQDQEIKEQAAREAAIASRAVGYEVSE